MSKDMQCCYRDEDGKLACNTKLYEQEYYYFGCRPAKWVAFFVTDVGAVGACPANVNPLRAESPIEPRRKLGLHVGCETITDRIACGMAIDGREVERYRNQPCMPFEDRRRAAFPRLCSVRGWSACRHASRTRRRI